MTPLEKRFPRVATIEEFFADRVIKSPGCWSWTGKKTALGYGQIKFRGVSMLAHRYSYEQAIGPIRPGGVIDHLCHNANCVNPAHLRVATHSQNMQNLRGAQTNNLSGARNVTWAKANKKWRVTVTADGRRHYGGYFDTLEEASAVAESLRRELHS